MAIPEAWSALGGGGAPWPTISGTIGEIEYRHPWAALVVVGVIVFVAYYAFRYRLDDPAHPQPHDGRAPDEGGPAPGDGAVVAVLPGRRRHRGPSAA